MSLFAFVSARQIWLAGFRPESELEAGSIGESNKCGLEQTCR